MSVLSLNNVKKSYKLGDGSEFPVLKGINVSFDKGELVSIIGESGSGKSTLMNIIGGLDSKFEGEVLVDGKNIGAFTEKELDIYRKNKIGFIFQSFNLVPHLTILDNVALALTLSNVKRSEQVERAKEMLEKVNKLGIGPQGFGGKTTAIGLNIETMPTHIAGMPCAVNINCHVTRHKSVEL